MLTNKQKFTNKRKIARISLLAISIAWANTGQTADFYQVIDLGSLGEVSNENIVRSAEAFAINSLDSVVGNANGVGFTNHAFIYQNNSLSELGFLDHSVYFDATNSSAIEGSGVSFAFGINDDFAVGYSIESEITQITLITADGESVSDFITDTDIAVYFDTNSLTINKIPPFLPGSPEKARAIAINDNNLVVGFGSFDPEDGNDADDEPLTTKYDRGFFYDIDADSLIKVNPIEGEDAQLGIVLRAVNNDGYAVGISEELIDNIRTRQLIVVDVNDTDTVEKIEIFGGTLQLPWAVNNARKIVGGASTNDSSSAVLEAFIYDVDLETVTSLGFLNDNFKYSEAFDINESDQVVGISQLQKSPSPGLPGLYHAFLYEDDSLKDLNKLISCEDASAWLLHEARSINDSGVITGTGIFEGEKRAFMLMPLVGNAPNCEDSSSGGSVPVIGLLLLTVLSMVRRNKK